MVASCTCICNDLCLSLCRFIHGAALKRTNQVSSTSRTCPHPQPQPLPLRPCPPPLALATPTKCSLRPVSLHCLPPLHPRHHISATLMPSVRTDAVFAHKDTDTPWYCQLWIMTCCLCLHNLQLLTTQVNAWPTPAPPIPSQPAGSFTRPMSWHVSHQGEQNTASDAAGIFMVNDQLFLVWTFEFLKVSTLKLFVISLKAWKILCFY